MARSKGRSGRPWQRLRRQVLAESTHCARCGQPLRPELPWRHPYSSTVDHIVSLCEGGHPTDRANLAAMHRTCNVRKENARRKARALGTSRDW
jgi:5-methylcytosine-specific restriction endonuclease McrA